MGPFSKLDSICHDIEQAALPPIPRAEQRRKSWISTASWVFVDLKNALRKLPGPTNQAEYRRLTRCLKLSLKEDRKQRAALAGALAEAELNEGNIREAWSIIRRWFVTVTNRPLPPSREDLRKVTNDRIKLYSKALPPDRIPVLVAPFDIDDVVPEPSEIMEAVRRLRNGKAPGPSKVRAEHFKEWVEEATREENPYQGNCDRVVELVQCCFQERQVPTQMSWSTVVLLPKGNGDYQGIGLLKIS